LTIEDALAFADWKDTNPDVWEDQLEKLSNPHVMVDVVFGEAKRVVTERQALVKARTDLQAAGYKLIVGERMISYNDPRSIGRLGISYTEHAHCPGAEVHITGSSKDWYDNALRWGTHLCANPKKHHPDEVKARTTDTPAKERVETDEERQEREAEEKIEAGLVAADDAREVWLTNVFMDDDTAHLPIRADLLAAIGERCLHRRVTCELPVNADDDALIAPKSAVDRLIFGATYNWSCIVPDSSWDLQHMTRGLVEGWSGNGGVDALAYLTLIERLGYTMSETDQHIKNELAAAVAEVAAAKTADEVDVDDTDTADGA